MSLINDALKRAKEAQRQKPPENTGGPPLRPVEARPARRANLWLMPVFAVVVAAAAILLWQWFQQSRRTQQVANHAASPAPSSPTPGPVAPVLPAPQPVQSASVVSPSTTIPQPVPTALQPATPAPVPTDQSATDLAPGVPATNGAPVSAVAAGTPAEDPAKPAPLKLQGIIFHPTKPSAVIKGKLLFVGDRLGEWRVLAIDPESVTLVGGGRTNVLTLE